MEVQKTQVETVRQTNDYFKTQLETMTAQNFDFKRDQSSKLDRTITEMNSKIHAIELQLSK